MALEATHIKFALDLKNRYEVQDMKKYISGTIYPDSRYVTGIDRTLTHGEDILKTEFAKNDFRKGWQVHQICDSIQHQVFRDNIDFLNRHPQDKWEENKWVEFSAAKIVQDMEILKVFNIQPYLEYLEYVYNPNGEDIAKVKEYNLIMVNLYKDKKEISLEDNINMWRSLGIGDELCEKVKGTTKKFLNDKKLVRDIYDCYQKMLSAV